VRTNGRGGGGTFAEITTRSSSLLEPFEKDARITTVAACSNRIELGAHSAICAGDAAAWPARFPLTPQHEATSRISPCRSVSLQGRVGRVIASPAGPVRHVPPSRWGLLLPPFHGCYQVPRRRRDCNRTSAQANARACQKVQQKRNRKLRGPDASCPRVGSGDSKRRAKSEPWSQWRAGEADCHYLIRRHPWWRSRLRRIELYGSQSLVQSWGGGLLGNRRQVP